MTENNLQLALYFLELLYSKGPLPINVLSEIYQSRVFPNQIISLDCAMNEIIQFLRQYPSLFQIDSDFVFPISSDNSCHSDPLPTNNNQAFFNLSRLTNTRRLSVDDNDIALESEAVKYFQRHLSKKEERWVPIKSLAGHLSQASENIRKVVGNQSLFTAFLMRHSHVFEIQGELVGVKDIFVSNKPLSNTLNGKRRSKISNQSTDSRSVKSDDTSNSDSLKSNQIFNTKKRTVKDNNLITQVVSNIILSNATKLMSGNSDIKNSVSVALSGSDYKTIFFLRETIKSLEENKKSCNLANIMENIICATANNIKNIIGYTQIELEEYLMKHALFFDILECGLIKCSEISNINIIITDNCHLDAILVDNECTSLSNKEGSVYHISKLWGIIDLGQHEHVFFDKSIFKNIEDLQKYFQIGEKIYFNAELAAKDSRAKWKATRVWKEVDHPILQGVLSKTILENKYESNTKLNMPDDIEFSDDDLEFEISKHINNFKLKDCLEKTQCESEDENTMRSIQSIGIEEEYILKSNEKKMFDIYSAELITNNCNVGTQTMSTGEIMAINFYHDGITDKNY